MTCSSPSWPCTGAARRCSARARQVAGRRPARRTPRITWRGWPSGWRARPTSRRDLGGHDVHDAAAVLMGIAHGFFLRWVTAAKPRSRWPTAPIESSTSSFTASAVPRKRGAAPGIETSSRRRPHAHRKQLLVQTLLGLPIFRSEWVLYLLLALSVISVGVMLERWIFYTRRSDRRRRHPRRADQEPRSRRLRRGGGRARRDRTRSRPTSCSPGSRRTRRGPSRSRI